MPLSPIRRRRRRASTPERYLYQLSSNTFPRSERVKTKPRSIHIFRPENRRKQRSKYANASGVQIRSFTSRKSIRPRFTPTPKSPQAAGAARRSCRHGPAVPKGGRRKAPRPPPGPGPATAARSHQPSGPNQQRPHRRPLAAASPQAGAGLSFQNTPQTSVAPCPRLRRSRTRRHTWSRTF